VGFGGIFDRCSAHFRLFGLKIQLGQFELCFQQSESMRDSVPKYNEDPDVEDGLSMLLGGLSSTDMAIGEWKEEQIEKSVPLDNESDSRASFVPAEDLLKKADRRAEKIIVDLEHMAKTSPENAYKETHPLFYKRAFSLDARGVVCRPAVRIVNLNNINNRGFALVATKAFSKGSVIFTESALDSVQIPAAISQWSTRQEKAKSSDGASSDETFAATIFDVKGCQYCFRSLEPVSCLAKVVASKANPSPQLEDTIPLSHLWPVTDHGCVSVNGSDYEDDSEQFKPYGEKQFQCVKCQSAFCSESCYNKFGTELGNCCTHREAILSFFKECDSDRTTDQDEECHDRAGRVHGVDPSDEMFLAVRLFCAAAHRHRRDKKVESCLEGLNENVILLDGICGNSSDMSPLEIGIEVFDREGEARYSLAPLHSALCSILSIESELQAVLSVEYFEQLAAITARNGFAHTTQSPFSVYYQSLLRECGRGTLKHKKVMSELAKALGSPDGTLNRSMDKDIARQCAVRTASLFPLTAKTNHSCDPNCEALHGVFPNSRTDIVASKDIEKGEELTISYINIGPGTGKANTRRNHRQKLLRARYLFMCDCPRCKNDS
jgi:hypothetical protein